MPPKIIHTLRFCL